MKAILSLVLFLIAGIAAAQVSGTTSTTSSSSAYASSGSRVAGSGISFSGSTSSAWGSNINGVVTGGQGVNLFATPGGYASGTATSPMGSVFRSTGTVSPFPQAVPYVAPTWSPPR